MMKLNAFAPQAFTGKLLNVVLRETEGIPSRCACSVTLRRRRQLGRHFQYKVLDGKTGSFRNGQLGRRCFRNFALQVDVGRLLLTLAIQRFLSGPVRNSSVSVVSVAAWLLPRGKS